MVPLLYIGFIILGAWAMLVAVNAQGAIHEGVAAILLLASIACLIGAGICTRMDRIRRAIERADENNWKIGHAQWRELREPGNKDPEPIGTASEK